MLGPTPQFTWVQRLRLEDVEADVAEIRGLAADHDHSELGWSLGPSTRPVGLYEQLVALGATEPEDRINVLAGMATTEPPEPGPPEIEVRPVTTFEEFECASEINYLGFEVPERLREIGRRLRGERWHQLQETSTAVGYLAYVNGKPVAHALGVFAPLGCLLVGGATLPEARGRGAYRALVRARWDEAVQRGTPALVVHAAPSSEPILHRLGFQEVCRLHSLQDPA
jgi:GNAT superfamily N-acetyltransferase